ncbi:MAG TPA: hypothetical protein GXX14_04065 [Clostridiaceae bacterium]|nr:hypothetical protein [Clostridiaceae bacterium]
MLKSEDKKILLFVALISIIGALFLVAVTSRFGPGISHDSVAYIYASRSFLNGNGFRYFGYEAPYVQWPPLLPVALALFEILGLDALTASRLINIICLSLTIFFTGVWLDRYVKFRPLVIVGVLAVLLSIPLTYVSRYTWSEPLFILFATLFLFVTGLFTEKEDNRNFYLSALFASLACLTRYIGAVFIVTGVIVVFIKRKGIVKKILHSMFFGFISFLPLSLWLVRNYIVSSTLTGIRTGSKYTFSQNANLAFNVLISWFLPAERLKRVQDADILLALKLLTVGVLLFCFMGIIAVFMAGILSANSKGMITEVFVKKSHLLVPVIFFTSYTLYLVVMSSKIAFDAIDNRLMSPVFIPLLLIILSAMDTMITAHRGNIAKYVVLVSFAFWTIHPLSNALVNLRDSVQKGTGGFSTVRWINRETIKYLQRNPTRKTVFSNYPDAIYILTGTPAMYPPRKNCGRLYGMEQFKQSMERIKLSYLIWFKGNTNSLIYNVKELSEFFNVRHIAEVEDGDIYLISL